MREFLKSWKFKILMGIVALLVGLMVYSAAASGAATLPEAIFGAVISPVQRFSTSVTDGVKNFLDKFVNANKYYLENEQLKKQLGEYYNQIYDYEKIKSENEELRKVIGLKEQYPDFEFSPPASVIARNMGDVFGGFSIDKGKNDSVSLYDPVITADGLVGYVTEVAPTYSRVTTVLSTEMNIGVTCVRTKNTGVLIGDIKLAENGDCRMGMIDKDSDMKEGDIIVTTGQSGIFPEGRVIGTVLSVDTEDSGLSLYAVIKPVVDMGKLSSVFVITNFQGQGLGYDQTKE